MAEKERDGKREKPLMTFSCRVWTGRDVVRGFLVCKGWFALILRATGEVEKLVGDGLLTRLVVLQVELT